MRLETERESMDQIQSMCSWK